MSKEIDKKGSFAGGEFSGDDATRVTAFRNLELRRSSQDCHNSEFIAKYDQLSDGSRFRNLSLNI